VLAEIGSRITADRMSEDIANEFDRARPRYVQLRLPNTFTGSWVNPPVGTLREDMVASVDDS
jgi:hypothetical protein